MARGNAVVYLLIRMGAGLGLMASGVPTLLDPIGGLPHDPIPYASIIAGALLVVGALTPYALWLATVIALWIAIDGSMDVSLDRIPSVLQTPLVLAGLYYLLLVRLQDNRFALDASFASAYSMSATDAAVAPIEAAESTPRSTLARAVPRQARSMPARALPSEQPVEQPVPPAEAVASQTPSTPKEMALEAPSTPTAAAAPASATAPAPADAVPASPGSTAIAGATKVLAKHIGPVARIVSKKAQKELSISPDSITKDQYDCLVLLISQQVTNAASASKFMEEATALGANLGEG